METLTDMRRALDRIDADLLELLGQRMAIAHAIGRRKRDRGLPVPHPRRDAKVMSGALAHARRLRLGEPFVERLYALILAESRDIQERIVSQGKERR